MLHQSLDDHLVEQERAYLRAALEHTAGKVAEAARIARRNRSDFYRLLVRRGINHLAFRPAE